MRLFFLSACVTGEEGVIAAGRAHSGSLAGPVLAGSVRENRERAAMSMREALDRRQAHRSSDAAPSLSSSKVLCLTVNQCAAEKKMPGLARALVHLKAGVKTDSLYSPDFRSATG